MPGQDLGNALIRVMTAQSAVYQHQAVVLGSAEDTCTLASVSNQSNFIGFALNDQSVTGQTVAVHMAGGIAKAIAGANVSAGAFQYIEGTDGRLCNLTVTNSNRYIIAQALRDGVDGDVIPVLIHRFIQNGT